MPAVHSLALACKIVKEHFGKLAEAVACCLLKKGRQTFPELLRNCNNTSGRGELTSTRNAAPLLHISAATLKQVLLVLIQQNCVETRLQQSEVLVTGVRPAVYLYEAQLGNILQIIRRPKLLQYIREDTPASAGSGADVSILIIEALLEHGRLRYDQVTNAVIARMTEDNAAAAAAAAAQPLQQPQQPQQPDNADKHQQQQQEQDCAEQPQQQHAGGQQLDAAKVAEYKEAVRWSFVQLLQEHYIERAPPCNLPPVTPPSKAQTKSRKAAPKPGSVEYAEQQSRAIQELAHKGYSESRFRAPRELVAGTGMEVDDILGGVTAETSAAAAAAAGGGAAAAAAAKTSKKRKKVAGGVSEESAAAASAAAAAAAAAESKAMAKQAAALASKRRKTGSKTAVATAVPADAAAAAAGVGRDVSPDVKVEDGGYAAAGSGSSVNAAAGSGRGAAVSSRKTPAAADEADPPTAAELLWRVNPEEFNRRFRNKVMVKLVTDKLGNDMGTILAAMLSHGRRFESGVRCDQGVAMSVQDVCQALKAGQDAGRLPELSEGADVKALLEALSYDSLNSVTEDVDNPAGVTYCVNMTPVLFRARVLQLQAVLRDKFGLHGLRVYQTLLLKGQLEQKQIAEQAMQPHKETRELLYRMFRSGYIQLQDIPRTADRAPSRCFYTWGVDLEHTFAQLGDDLYRAASNLHARLTLEMEQQAELIELVEAARAAGALNFNVTASQRRTLERLAKVSGALATSLLRLDDMIALFHEY